MTKWVIHPPPGMAFKNEFGSEVSIAFEEGREGEVVAAITGQLHQQHQQHLAMARAREQAQGGPQVGLSLDRAGNIVPVPTSGDRSTT